MAGYCGDGVEGLSLKHPNSAVGGHLPHPALLQRPGWGQRRCSQQPPPRARPPCPSLPLSSRPLAVPPAPRSPHLETLLYPQLLHGGGGGRAGGRARRGRAGAEPRPGRGEEGRGLVDRWGGAWAGAGPSVRRRLRVNDQPCRRGGGGGGGGGATSLHPPACTSPPPPPGTPAPAARFLCGPLCGFLRTHQHLGKLRHRKGGWS